MKLEWFPLRRVIAVCVLFILAGAHLGGVALAAWSVPGAVDEKQSLKTAWRAYEDNNYEGARTQASEIIARGRLTGRDLGDAWLLKGLCESDLGNRDGAIQAFLQGIRLNPEARVEGAAYIPLEIANFNEAMALWRQETSSRSAPPTLPQQQPQGSIQPAASTGGRSLLRKPAFRVTAGVVLVGAVALLVGRDRKEVGVSPLPGLPSHP